MSNTPEQIVPAEIMPFHELHGHELIQHVRKTPTVLYAIFVELVRQFYGGEDNNPLGTPSKVWKPDPETSQIWIDSEMRWEDAHPEFRPAVYVSIGPIQYQSMTGRSDGHMGGDLRDAETYFSRSGSGIVSFVHVGGTAGEAVTLADSTFDYLDAFASVIRCDFGFTKFYAASRVPRQQMPKESKERYSSTVAFNFDFQDCWSLKLESQKLKTLTLRAGQQLAGSVIV